MPLSYRLSGIYQSLAIINPQELLVNLLRIQALQQAQGSRKQQLPAIHLMDWAQAKILYRMGRTIKIAYQNSSHYRILPLPIIRYRTV